jgi:DNA helicase-2/ATP-dependent DNA helicase PcrA
MKLRPAQEEILKYESGRMAISAVPGSGKTFVLTRLAALLISAGKLQVDAGQRVLIVTYLNSSVDTFQARIANWLRQLGLPPTSGYDVRTLHSLAREILLFDPAAAGVLQEFPVLDEGQRALLLARAVDGWIHDNAADWYALLPPEAADSPRLRARWRNLTEETARDLIRVAKNHRYPPGAIRERLHQRLSRWTRDREGTGPGGRLYGDATHRPSPLVSLSLIAMLTGIYSRYQNAVEIQGALDFDDLVWRAADLLAHDPGVLEALRQRWPYVLEDEAQDSLPLQERLLETLTGPDGNWVRVGDPNQAITSSFTSADPIHFRRFLEQPEVVVHPLPDSGRSSRRIIGLANRLVEWACDDHPVCEVRQAAFLRQRIRPTPPDDAQPNPPDAHSTISIHVYGHREREELPTVAQDAGERARRHPEQTVAILVPTNETGFAIGENLDSLGADFDELLRGSGRTQEIAAALYSVLGLLADPLNARRLEEAYAALLDMESLPPPVPMPSGRERILTLLRSVQRPEALFYPQAGSDMSDALPRGVATLAEEQAIASFVTKIHTYFDALELPPDALVLAVADDLFRTDGDLAIAYQISGYLRTLSDADPSWRLPELAAQLEGIAAGSVHLPGLGPRDIGYEPQPGRITLTTQHRAKGLEWDTVFLVGIDGFWIPSNLEAHFMGVDDYVGGDLGAEATAQLRELMEGDNGSLPDLTPTQSAHVEVISERLRLLYVGITRARRNLFISRSRAVTTYQQERDALPATALGVLYEHLRHETSKTRSREG